MILISIYIPIYSGGNFKCIKLQSFPLYTIQEVNSSEEWEAESVLLDNLQKIHHSVMFFEKVPSICRLKEYWKPAVLPSRSQYPTFIKKIKFISY